MHDVKYKVYTKLKENEERVLYKMLLFHEKWPHVSLLELVDWRKEVKDLRRVHIIRNLRLLNRLRLQAEEETARKAQEPPFLNFCKYFSIFVSQIIIFMSRKTKKVPESSTLLYHGLGSRPSAELHRLVEQSQEETLRPSRNRSAYGSRR